jgi:hypothetical protein
MAIANKIEPAYENPKGFWVLDPQCGQNPELLESVF